VAHFEIRRGEARDLAELTAIYNYYVCETAITFDLEPFVSAQREAWFANFAAKGPHRLFVGVRDGSVVGYACSHAFRAKAAYDRTVETSVYLAADATGEGLGARLYAQLFEGLAATDAHLAVAGMTLPNPASDALHRRFGFEPVGVFREVGHKFGRAWDVQWWQRRLNGPSVAG
jgi:phosphinothricin acetyltransferase